MPQYQAPTPYPDFAEGGDALVDQPTPSLQASGFTLSQRPSAGNVNWLFRQLGRAVRYLSQGVNAVLVGAAQETDYRLLGGGIWSWNATSGVLAWSEAAYIACPGLTDAANTIAAGSVTLAAGQLAYVAANVPFATTGDTASGSSTIANLAFESGIVVGATCTGSGIPAGATVTAVSQSDSTITLSAPATASATGVQLVFATSGALSVKAVAASSFAPSSNTIVLARCAANAGMPAYVHVGVNAGQMLMRNGEAKILLGQGYVSTFTATAGVDMAANTAVYISPGGFFDANRHSGWAYPAEVAGTPPRAGFVGVVPYACSALDTIEVVSTGRLSTAGTNYAPGTPLYLSPTTPGSLTTTAPSTVGQYVVPVAVALRSNLVLLTAAPKAPLTAVGDPVDFQGPITATSVTSAAGFKQQLDMGYYFSSSDNANEHQMVRVAWNYNTNQPVVVLSYLPMVASGSILGFALSGSITPAATATFVVRIYRNGQSIFNLSALTPGKFYNLALYGYNKGGLPFSANDNLYCTVTQPNAGAITSVTVQLEVELSA